MMERCLRGVHAQLHALVDGLLCILEGNVVGIYLHSSLAMGCFNPCRSDLDLLVVVKDPLILETKRRVAELLLKHSGHPSPAELSILSQQVLHPWQYPTPFEFHYSEDWRERYTRYLAGDGRRTWNDDRTDPDLAAHIAVTRERGICLYGRPIEEVFPEVPEEHFRAAILADFEWAKGRLTEDPVYFILNACRTYAYLWEGWIASKSEAGEWALSALPETFHNLVAAALVAYRGDRQDAPFDSCRTRAFSAYLERKVQEAEGKFAEHIAEQ